MSKKRNRSRFTKTDVNTICEMQRKIEAYESFIMALCGLVQHRGEEKYLCLLRDTPIDDCMNTIWCAYMKQAEELKKYKDVGIYDVVSSDELRK